MSKKNPRYLPNPFKDRSLVQRRRAADYLLITLLSFGFSVGATRLFLELTGFPQLGSGNLHIAHVIWGGLFLFVASLLPIIYVNEWVIALSGLISGFGVGLFIDEVGKFITQTNDYFYPSAAPLVYALFLLTVFIFLQVKIERRPSTRSLFYEVMERLTEIMDHDLSEDEAELIQIKLKMISDRNDAPDLAQMAATILSYFDSDKKQVVATNPTFIEKVKINLQEFEAAHFSRRRMKTALIIGLIAWAAWSIFSPISYFTNVRNPEQFQLLINQLITHKLIMNESGLTWFQAKVLLEGGTGILAIISAILLTLKREKAGIWLGIGDMLIALLVVNLLVFYFEQFSTIILAAYQFVLFALLIRYQRRFLLSKNRK